jgi:16S rRNA (cytosine967-C5)-methyltransferase
MIEVEKEQDARLARMVADGGDFGDRLRSLVLELWQRTRLDWGFVSERLSVTFRRERSLGSSERRFVAETVYGMVRHLRRIDAAVAAGAKRVAPPRDEQRLLAYLVLEQGLEPAKAAGRDPSIDWKKAAGIDAVIARERRPAARIALASSLPDWLAARLVADWGDEAEPLARALNQRAPMTVRATLLKTTRAALAEALAKEKLATTPGKLSDTALIVESRMNLFGLEAFKRGELEAQDEGSQALADLVDARGTVVDLCAGAGGKTLAMAARMGNRGRIIASDVDDKKLEEMKRRARRAGVSNTRAVGPDELDGLTGKADRVLVDAPCSGVGSLRRNPEARWRLTEADIPKFAARQKALCLRGAELLAPGGLLVYGTCTVLAAENAEVIEAVLAARPDLTRERPDHHFLPHRDGTDGFYGAILRKQLL